MKEKLQKEESGIDKGNVPKGADPDADVVFRVSNLYFAYPNALRAIKQGRNDSSGKAGGEEEIYVLRNISMYINRGERVAVLGPNGGGKSTLLKILDGLLEPTKGKVVGMGIDLGRSMYKKKVMFEFRKKVGFVFQNPDEQLFSPTVFDDIIFGPLHLGFSKEEILSIAERTMKMFGITHLRDKHPYNLSGGEKKKAALASVLSIDPDVILLDEPTVGLDPKSRRELITIINDLHRRGKTIITATHDVNAIPDIADRVYVLNGEILAEGSTREIFSDISLLKRANLEIPEILKLFRLLNAFGYNPDNLPLSIDEAIEQLTRTIETEGGHIHLHIHEHTHSKIAQLRSDISHSHSHPHLHLHEEIDEEIHPHQGDHKLDHHAPEE